MTTGTVETPATTPKVGLFHVVYESDGVMPGGVSFILNLVVSTPTHHMTGILHATQAVSPPLDLESSVSGTYVPGPEPIEPPPIIAWLKGYPIHAWPAEGGVGPVLQPNCDMTLSIKPNWESGVANLAFVDATGHWRHVSGVKFKTID